MTALGWGLILGGTFALGVFFTRVYDSWRAYDDNAHSKVGYNPPPNPMPPRPARVTVAPPRKRKKR